MVSYTISQPRLHTLLSEYHQTFKIWSPTRPACTYLHAGNLYNLLILYQIHLARILQYASTLIMAPLPCISHLYILPINIFDNFSK